MSISEPLMLQILVAIQLYRFVRIPLRSLYRTDIKLARWTRYWNSKQFSIGTHHHLVHIRRWKRDIGILTGICMRHFQKQYQ